MPAYEEEKKDPPMETTVTVETEPADMPKGEGEGETGSIVGQAPAPTEPIPVASYAALCEAINAAVGVISEGKAPRLDTGKYQTVGAEKPTKAPLDPEEWMNLSAASMMLAKMAEIDPNIKPMAFDPAEIVTRKGMQAVTRKLSQAAQSSAVKAALPELVKQMTEAAGLPPEGEGEPAEPEAPMMEE